MDPFASALEQAAAVRRGEVSARELVDAYLQRIERLNPRLNAFWLTTPELAREQAAAREEGPLAGAATCIKDLAPMAGYPHTLGSRPFEHQVAELDAFVVGRVRAAGCPILGRTTTPEFGSRPVTEFGLHGTARNPWDPSRTPGGSSGGAAAALAAGLCAWSHGSDGGGSVRIPASCCGLVGLKPSRGRISPGPAAGEGWAGLSTDGVLARTVDDAAAALDALAGHLPGDPYWAEPEGSYLADRRRPGRLRVAVQATADRGVHPEIQALVRRAGLALEGLGHHVEEGGPDTSGLLGPFRLISSAGAAVHGVQDLSILDPINARMVSGAARATAGDYAVAVDALRRHSRRVVAFWADHDLLVTSTLTQPPYPVGFFADRAAWRTALEWITFTFPYNCTGQPAVSLPLGTTAEGLPLGVQLVGPPRGELPLLAVAAQLEAAMPWRDRRPPGCA